MVTTKIIAQASPPQAVAADAVVRDLTKKQQVLTEAMQRLIRFQRQTLALKNSPTMDAALDTMESLLIEVVDFAYASLQHRNGLGSFSPLRQICPESISLDYPLMEWVMGTQEVSVLPIDLAVEGSGLKSLILLPFGAHHIMLLWLEQDTDAFTQEQEALLSILSREMAAVLDAHHYRLRLEKTRAAMSDIIESVPLGLMALDHRNRVAMINSTAEIALNIRRQQAIGADYRAALPPEVTELLDRATENGGTAEEAELAVGAPGADGQVLGVTVSPIRSEDGSGKTGQVVVCRDLRLSREVSKLRELDSMKNDFLSLVTHELRTPLTSIMAYSETLMMDGNDAVPPEWREYITIIHDEGKRLCQLIDDVLDLTRMEAGKMEYEYKEQDPNEIIGTVVMEMTSQIEGKHHELELDLAEDIGNVRLVPDRFHQVLSTVVSNAVKYTNPGGKIVVRSRLSDPMPDGGAPSVTITVEDNGIGISPENIGKVFSKFEMVEAVQNHTAGTGLGLAISKRIVEEGHNGKIWLESEFGKGTKVFIRIPARTA